MRKLFFAAILTASLLRAAEGEKLIDSLSDATAWKPQPEKSVSATAEAESKEGGGIKFNAQAGSTFAIALHVFKPDPDWNAYDGLAFWVKGDGSANFGCLRIQAGNYEKGYLANFPLKDTAWHEVRLAWGDFVPSAAGLPDLGAADGHRPGDINLVAFGKSWNFNTQHQSPDITFSVSCLRLVKGVQPGRRKVAIDKFPPVSEVVKKMAAGEPVTILSLGDSITWGTSAGGNANAYPALLGALLRKRYGNEKITVQNRAIGGSTTAKGRQWLIRDVSGIEADLITVMFGFNEIAPVEKRAGAAKSFVANLAAYIEEAAGLMKAPPACVLVATIPGKEKHWETLDPYAESVREFGRNHLNVTVADANSHFKTLGREKYASFMADEAHPNEAGQKEMARALFQAITGEAAKP